MFPPKQKDIQQGVFFVLVGTVIFALRQVILLHSFIWLTPSGIVLRTVKGKYNITANGVCNNTFALQKYHSNEVGISLKFFPTFCFEEKSLYFDNYTDKALREKLNGVDKREKFRIRYYNEDTSFIRLEKKSKINGLSSKQSAPITAYLDTTYEKGTKIILLDENGEKILSSVAEKSFDWLCLSSDKIEIGSSCTIVVGDNTRIEEEILSPVTIIGERMSFGGGRGRF